MKPIRLFSALTAAVMSVSAIPLRVLADEEFSLPIETIGLSGASTTLIRGEVPKYTMQLSAESAAQAEITEELWYDAFNHDAAFTRSGGEAVPLFDQSAYIYAVILEAKEGSFFADSFSLTYDGEPVDADSYSYEQFGPAMMLLYCGFLPLTESTDGVPVLCGDLTEDGIRNIGDAVLLMRLLNEDDDAPVSDGGLRAADVNCDGTLSMLDAKDLLLYLTGQASTVAPALSDEFGGIELPPPTAVCEPLQEGNSQAFEEKPLPGLTISAPENALSYDGQLQTAPLTEQKTQELTEQFSECGIIMAAGWEIRAGLEPDAHLPGFYHSEFDLTALELPEELYDSVRVMRVDDNGVIHRYAAEVEGSTVKWDSDQNSFVVLGIVAIGVGVAAQFTGMTIAAIYTVQIIAALVAGAIAVWELSKGEGILHEAEMYVNRMRFYETKHFTIWYALGQTSDDGHKARLAAKENAARERAMNEVLEEVADSGKANSPKFLIEAELRTRKYLAEDAEYQEMLTEVERVPADVRMLARQLETAYDYLADQKAGELVNQFNLNYKPDVLFTPSSSALGLAVTPKTGADPYLLVERSRDLVDDPLLIPESADIMDYYGTSIDPKTADNLLITATHEIFHIHQNKYFSGTDIKHLKFSEFSAMVLQNHCAEYYDKNGITTSEYKEDVDQYYETYAVPFDEVLGEKEGQANGYTLSHFYLYLEKQTGKKHTALEFIEQYKKQNYDTAKALSNLFGFGDDLEKLSKYWRSFLASYADIIGGSAYAIKTYTTDSQHGFPKRQRRVRLSSGNQSVKVDMTANDFTATETVIFGPDGDRKTGTWQALIVKDGSIGERFKDFGFVFPRNQQKKFSAVRTRNGAAVSPQNDAYPIIERQGYGNTGSASYTVYLLMQPDAPDLSFDEETNEIVVRVRQPGSATARDRATDCMRLNVYVDGYLRAIRNIKHEDLGEDIRISVYETFIPLNRPVTVTAEVCESVTGDAESLTYFGPLSEKAVLTVERTVETTTAPTETTTTRTETTQTETADITDQTNEQTLNPPGNTTADVTEHTDAGTETGAPGTSEPNGDNTERQPAETTAETTEATETETAETTTETTTETTVSSAELHVEPRNIQFSYVEGYYGDAEVGGLHRKPYPNPNDEVDFMFGDAPHFRLFADGTFELTVYGNSGSNIGYYTYPDGEKELDDEYEWDYSGFTVSGRLLRDNTGKANWCGIITHCTAPSLSAYYKEYQYSAKDYDIQTFSGSPSPVTQEIADDLLYGEYDVAHLPPFYGEIWFEEMNPTSMTPYTASLDVNLNTTGGEVHIDCSFFDTSENKAREIFFDDEVERADGTLEFDLTDRYMYIESSNIKSSDRVQVCYYEDAYIIAIPGTSCQLVSGETVTWSNLWLYGRCEQARNGTSWTGPIQFTDQDEVSILLEWDTEDENGEPVHNQKELHLAIQPVSGTVSYSGLVDGDTKSVTFTVDVLTDMGHITFTGSYTTELPEADSD